MNIIIEHCSLIIRNYVIKKYEKRWYMYCCSLEGEEEKRCFRESRGP